MKEKLFEEFKLYFPLIAKKAVDWVEESGINLIVTLDDGRKVMYDDLDSTIRRLPKDSNNLTEEECAYEFGVRLRRLMWRKGVNQQELSEATGISQPMLSKYVNGKTLPGFYNLDKIAKYLKVSVDVFRYI